ncbi:MAG: hypothetical protein ABR884_01875 [Minisyncoccia bacterium]|jgi:hypothetical protein
MDSNIVPKEKMPSELSWAGLFLGICGIPSSVLYAMQAYSTAMAAGNGLWRGIIPVWLISLPAFFLGVFAFISGRIALQSAENFSTARRVANITITIGVIDIVLSLIYLILVIFGYIHLYADNGFSFGRS